MKRKKSIIPYNSRDVLTEMCRNACLWPIAGRTAVPEAYKSLISQWQRRLKQLKDAGWSPVQDQRILDTMLGCSPFGAKHHGFAFRCRRLRLCPMCYARDILIGNYKALDWFLGISKHPDCCALVAASSNKEYLLDQPVPLARNETQAERDAMEAKDPIEFIFKRALRGRFGVSAYLKKAGIDVLGSRGNITISSSVSSQNAVTFICGEVFLVRRSQLGVVPDLKVQHNYGFWTLDSVVDRHKVADLFTKSMPYPMGMLEGDVEVTKRILNITSGARTPLSFSTGLLAHARRFMHIEKSLAKDKEHFSDGVEIIPELI